MSNEHLTRTLRGMVLPEGYNQAALTRAAEVIEQQAAELAALRTDAERYRVLRDHQFTYSPRITDPSNEWLGYTPEGLDAVCDAMRAAIPAGRTKETP